MAGERRPLRVLVVDDEPLVRVALRDVLAADPRLEIAGECGDGISALEACATLEPDVVLLDVQMPALSGVEVASELRHADHRPAVVFITAYDAYAVRAFELEAMDYVLKPFDDERVREALDRVVRRLTSSEQLVGAARDAKVAETLAALARRVAAPARFVASIAGRLRVIDASAVDWIEAADNYVRLHTASGSALVRETMKSVESRLDPAEFLRIHRSQIVRLSRVRELTPLDSGDYTVLLTTGHRLTLSRTYRDRFMARLQPGP